MSSRSKEPLKVFVFVVYCQQFSKQQKLFMETRFLLESVLNIFLTKKLKTRTVGEGQTENKILGIID